MSTLAAQIQQAYLPAHTYDIRTGMEVEVSQTIKEGTKERIQKFRGLVILTSGASPLDRTITVRRDVDGFGIEKIFPIYGPTIHGITIIRQFKVRRKNIGFIRKLRGKAARLKEVKNVLTKAKAAV